MSQHQSLASGQTMHEQFSDLGVTARKVVVNPRKLFGMLIGMPETGKTSLLASCDGCMIFNLDQSTIPVEEPDHLRAIVFPWVTPEGTTVDGHDKEMQLTWDAVEDKLKVLHAKAAANQPRPDMIAFDTIGGMLSLVMDHVVKKLGKKEWKEIDGRRGWDDVYRTIVMTCTSLRKSGYGVYLVGHLVNKVIQLDDERYTQKLQLTITDKFWTRLFWQFELVGAIVKEWKSETVESTTDIVIDGKTTTRKRREVQRVPKHYMTINREELAGITKGRVSFEDLLLPKTDAWVVFETAYLDNSPT